MDSKKHLIVMGKGGGTQVQADWSQSDSTAADYIKNKPTGLSNEWWGTQAEYDLIDPKDPDTVYHIEGDNNLTYRAFPQGWHTTGTMADLISDINNDSSAVVGMSYMDTVSFSDLPASLQQGEIQVDVVSEQTGLGKVLNFTLKSSNLSPYHWEYTSAYGAAGTWRQWALNTDIPTVNNATITLTQGGVTKGSFTLNQSGNDTIALDAGGAGGTADIPEEELNTITIYNESGATTFTKWDWTGGPVVSEIWNNGIKQTATVASPFTVATGVNHYLLTIPAGGQESIAAGLELDDKYGTYWVYAHNGYNTPMTGDYSNGNCNCVLNLMTGNEKYNLGTGSTGITYWFPDNNVQQVDVTSSNTFVFFDTTFNNIAFFPGYSWVDYNDIHCTIYVPANRRYEIMDILTQQITGTDYWQWESHIQGYDSIVMTDDYKYKTTAVIPAQQQADWNESDSSDPSYIQNKPSMTTETLTFTLSDQSTVTLTVYVQPTI